MMWVGMAAGAITSIAALPQVIKTVRTRSTKDLSLGQPLLLSIGIALWVVYGIQISDLPLISMNVLPLGANIFLASVKAKGT